MSSPVHIVTMAHRGRTGRRRKKRRHTCTCAESKVKLCGGTIWDPEVIELIKWMKLYNFCTSSLRPKLFNGTGRGLMTSRTIAPGDVIVSIPKSLLITTHTVISSDVGQYIKKWRSKLCASQLLTMFLVYEFLKGVSSQWSPYIAVLPHFYTNAVYWTPAELRLLPGHVRTKAEMQIKEMHSSYCEVAEFCCYYESQCMQAPGSMSSELYRWAWSTVNTRCVYMPQAHNPWVRDPQQDRVALAPFLDLLNHSSDVQITAGFSESTGCYEIRTQTPCARYGQVFISYGPHDNGRLLVEYGFIIPNNCHNTVPVNLDSIIQVCQEMGIAGIEKHITVIQEHALDKGLLVSLEGLSWNLEAALRVLAMAEKERYLFHHVLNGHHTSEENEGRKLELAKAVLQALSKQLEPTVEMNKDMLNEKECMALTIRQECFDIVNYTMDVIS